MCYKCANLEALAQMAAAAASLDNIAGSEQAQRAICNVITEVGNQFANYLRDERLEAPTTQLGTEPKSQATDGCAGSVGDHGQTEATSGQQEKGSGEVAAKQDDSELPSELLELLSYLRIRKNPLKA